MKSIYFLLPLFGSVLAGKYPTTEKCVATCPKFDCDTSNAANLCQCQNDQETACKKKCRDYTPVYKPCPVNPPQETCECEPVFCAQSWPESCYCGNAAKTACHKKCGGAYPVYETCPPRTTLTITQTSTSTSTSTRYPVATPTAKPTNQVCGGGRAGPTLDCPTGFACIANPFIPGSCGPACDQLGVCAEDKLCGGFGGFKCEDPLKVCMDDSRDECDPTKGGADCGGRCVYPEEIEVPEEMTYRA
ncbi:hypothetical protein Ptr902_09808 [Pyrenophora tritici-repentis]|nr:hypothetical protein Ptr902_09808 [Pyrenophora tritici-repentis]